MQIWRDPMGSRHIFCQIECERLAETYRSLPDKSQQEKENRNNW